MMTIADIHKHCMTFYMITGVAMQVHAEYHPGLLESAYEAAMVYLLRHNNLNKHYCMDLVADGDTIIELKAVKYVTINHRKQLWNYMHLTHMHFGLLFNFGSESLFSEWYYRRDDGNIIKLSWHENQLENTQDLL